MSQWRIVKLELAPTEDYPKGSPAMAFLLRIPLNDAGMIDRYALIAEPKNAFVRRFWLNEPDRSGVLRPIDTGWSFEFSDGERHARLEDVPITPDAMVKLTQADGTPVIFRVVSIAPD